MASDVRDQIPPLAELKAAHLTYVSDLDPGIRRRKASTRNACRKRIGHEQAAT